MSKTKKSKLLASMLCATVVAGLYAGPVMAAQSGLTVGTGGSAQSVTAASSVNINGVTLSGNKVTATNLQLGSTILNETNLKNVNNIFSTATGAKPVINVGGINVYDASGNKNFFVTSAGAVTAKGGATISATNGTTGANGKTAVSYNGVTDTVTGSNTNQQVTSGVTATAVTDTVYKDKDGTKTRAAVSTVGATGISDTLYNDNGTTSKMALSATSAQLASGSANFTANNSGTVGITGTNFKVDTTGNVTAAGAVTANNGITSNKTTTTGTAFGTDADSGLGQFNTAMDTLDQQKTVANQNVANSSLGYTDAKYTSINGQSISNFNTGSVWAGANNYYSDAKNQAQTYTTSTGKVTNDQNGLSVTSSQSSESVTVTETLEKESVEAEYVTPQANGATMGNVSVNKNNGTATYKVTYTDTDIENSFSNTSANGLSFSKTSTQKKAEYTQEVDLEKYYDGTNSNVTSVNYTQTDTTNSMSQNNGAFSMSGTVQNNTFADQDDFTAGKFESGTKTSNSVTGSNGSVSMTASKDYIDYTDGIAAGDVGYNQAANKTTVSSSIKVNSASGTDADDASGSITLSNSKVNYEYGSYDEFGKPSTTTAVNEYSTTATVGKGDFTVSGTRYDDDGKASGAGNMYVNSESYGTRLSQTNYKEDGTSQSATISLNNGAVTISGSDTASLKAGSYGFATTKDGVNTITGKNFAVAANGTLTLNNGTNNTLYVDASGNLTNTAKTNYDDGREYGSTLTNSATSGLTSNVTYTDTDGNAYSSKVTNTATGGLVTTVTGNGNTVTSKTSNAGITDSFVDANGTHTVTTNGNGTTFSATGSATGSTVINGSTITTGTIKAGNTTINSNGLTVGTGTTIGNGTITTGTLNVDTINLGSKIVDANGDTLYELSIKSDGSANFAQGNFKIGTNGALTDTVAYSNTNGDYTGKFTTNYSSNTLSNKLDKGDGVSQETALTTGYGSGSLIHNENGVQTAGLTVAATGATLAGNTSTYVKANNDGTITVNGTNLKVAANGTLTLNNGTNDTFKVDNYGQLTSIADYNGYKSTFKNSYSGTSTKVTKDDKTAESSTLYSGITDKFTDADGTHSVVTNGSGTRFTATDANGSTSYTTINGGTIKTGSTTINGTGMTVGNTSVSSGNVTVGNTQITSSSITTDTLNVNTINLGNKIVDKTTGEDIFDLTISANGSASFAQGNFKIGTNGALTNTITSGNNVGKFTTASNLINANVTNGNYTTDNKVTATGETTTVTSNAGGSGNGNTVTSSTTNTGISDKFTNGSVTAESTVNQNGITDKFTDENGKTHTVTTNGNGTTFGGTGTTGTTNINGNTVTVGTGNNQTVISGGTITTDRIVTDELVITGNGSYGNSDAEGTGNGGSIAFGGDGHITSNIVSGNKETTFETNVNGVTSSVTNGRYETSNTIAATGETTTVTDKNTQNTSSSTQTSTSIGDVITGGDFNVSETLNAANGTITNKVEAKDENGDITSSSTVTQDKDGMTVATGTGTASISGNDVSVSWKDEDGTNHDIAMSDIGEVENIDSELKDNDNYDGTVVGGINAEADIRRAEVNRLDNRIDKVEDRVDKVGAMAAAIANLRTMGYDPAAPTEIAVGLGQYRDETGAALGLFHYPNRDFMLSLSVSTSGDEVMGGIGATWKFGRKTPEQMLAAEKEKAAKAKLAKAEAMKKAAAEAKVAAQQAKHAKMAAEKAAK